MSLNFFRELYIDIGKRFLIRRVRVDETNEFNPATFPIAQDRVQAVNVGRVVPRSSRARTVVIKFSDGAIVADAKYPAHFR